MKVKESILASLKVYTNLKSIHNPFTKRQHSGVVTTLKKSKTMETTKSIPTVLPVIIEVVPSKGKKGYSLKHNQQHGWKGIITDTWAWFKFKSDAIKSKDELTKLYNK